MPTALPTLRRNWLVTLRAYQWTYFIGTLATGILTVGLAYLAFHAVGGGRVGGGFGAAAGTADYLGYVTIGAAALMFSTRMVLWVAKAQITEQREGTLESQMLAPARRLPYLIGVGAQALTTTLVEVAVMLAFAIAIGVRLPAPDPVSLVAAVGAATVAVFGISVPLSAIMITRRRGAHHAEHAVRRHGAAVRVHVPAGVPARRAALARRGAAGHLGAAGDARGDARAGAAVGGAARPAALPGARAGVPPDRSAPARPGRADRRPAGGAA